MCKKSRNISKKDKITVNVARQILTYLKWLDTTDAYQLYVTRIKPYINFDEYIKIVSYYDKHNNKVIHIKGYYDLETYEGIANLH